MPGPLVCVVVPVLDDAARLAACLAALADQAGDVPYEVVVVDNGSTDDSVQVARDARVHPVVVREARRGSYAARCAGVGASTAPLLAFTDADCVPARDWVAAGAAACAGGAPVAGRVVPTASDRPSVWERYDRATYLRQDDLVRQGFGATANLWVPRAVWDAVGPFDAALRSSGDLEWGRRAREAGHPVRYAAGVVVAHAPRTTARGTWALHRRLGAGWSVLAARGQWPPVRADAALRTPLGQVVDAVAADGPPLRRRELAPVHAVALAARWWGRLRG